MSKVKVLRVVNVVLGVALLNQAVTAIFHELLSHHVFETMHIGGGIALVVVAAIHLVLNWSWVKSNYCTKKSER